MANIDSHQISSNMCEFSESRSPNMTMRPGKGVGTERTLLKARLTNREQFGKSHCFDRWKLVTSYTQ